MQKPQLDLWFLRSFLSPLFVAKGYYGVDPRGPTSGNVASSQCDEGEQERNNRKCEGICCTGAIEQCGHKPSHGERGHNSEAGAEKREAGSLAQHEAENIAAPRAKREANPEFLRTLSNGVGDHAINADRGEDESNRCKDAKQKRGEPRPRERIRKKLIHWGDGGHGQLGVHLLKLAARCGHHREWIIGGPD
jgi:hypothetical protein